MPQISNFSNLFYTIWRVGSASEMIRMGYSLMFGKMFFVADFLSNRAKNGLFAHFPLDKLIACVELVQVIQVWGLNL